MKKNRSKRENKHQRNSEREVTMDTILKAAVTVPPRPAAPTPQKRINALKR